MGHFKVRKKQKKVEEVMGKHKSYCKEARESMPFAVYMYRDGNSLSYYIAAKFIENSLKFRHCRGRLS